MTYTTVQGDMWDSIAAKVMGSVYGMGDLLRENPHYHDYLVFPAGVVLTIPESESKPPETVPPWKR